MDINAPVNSFTLQDQTNYASSSTMISSPNLSLRVHLSIIKLLRGILLFGQVVLILKCKLVGLQRQALRSPAGQRAT